MIEALGRRAAITLASTALASLAAITLAVASYVGLSVRVDRRSGRAAG